MPNRSSASYSSFRAVRSRREPSVGASRASAARALFWLSCLLFTLLGGTAHASAPVPMCGARGETIAAPPISRAAREVPLAPSSCDPRELLSCEIQPGAPAPAPLTVAELTPRIAALYFALPPPASVSLLFDARERIELPPGHARDLERPPRRSPKFAPVH